MKGWGDKIKCEQEGHYNQRETVIATPLGAKVFLSLYSARGSWKYDVRPGGRGGSSPFLAKY